MLIILLILFYFTAICFIFILSSILINYLLIKKYKKELNIKKLFDI
jgi:hypothetical protein